MKALLDGDIIAYRSAASAEGDPEEIAILRTNNLLVEILETTQADSFICYLTGSNNFRKEIFPDYKANRKQPRPKHLEACREFLCRDYKAIVTDGHEADDELGMGLSNDKISCSIDKDLLQVPGEHYNFVRREFITITPEQGIRNFYSQMLIGDTSDNIKGVDGIGIKRAARLLDPLTTEEEMFDCVRQLYKDDLRFLINGQLLWIWREYKGIWQPMKTLSIGQGNIQQEEVQKYESTVTTQEETRQCMEHI